MSHNNLSSNLQYLINTKGPNLLELADSLKVSAELIEKLKLGELKNPSINTVSAIAKHFSIPIDDLVSGNLQDTPHITN